MIRPLRLVTIVVFLAAGAACSSAQLSSGALSPPSSQAALDEVKRLNQQAEKLKRNGELGRSGPVGRGRHGSAA